VKSLEVKLRSSEVSEPVNDVINMNSIFHLNVHGRLVIMFEREVRSRYLLGTPLEPLTGVATNDKKCSELEGLLVDEVNEVMIGLSRRY
jgi:hypothetical protein